MHKSFPILSLYREGGKTIMKFPKGTIPPKTGYISQIILNYEFLM